MFLSRRERYQQEIQRPGALQEAQEVERRILQYRADQLRPDAEQKAAAEYVFKNRRSFSVPVYRLATSILSAEGKQHGLAPRQSRTAYAHR